MTLASDSSTAFAMMRSLWRRARLGAQDLARETCDERSGFATRKMLAFDRR
jgi:hypothetical protein